MLKGYDFWKKNDQKNNLQIADLTRERGIKSTLELRGRIGKKIHVDLRGYMHLFNGYIFLQPQSEFRLTIRGAFPVYTYEQCDARLTGGDFILKYKDIMTLEKNI